MQFVVELTKVHWKPKERNVYHVLELIWGHGIMWYIGNIFAIFSWLSVQQEHPQRDLLQFNELKHSLWS